MMRSLLPFQFYTLPPSHHHHHHLLLKHSPNLLLSPVQTFRSPVSLPTPSVQKPSSSFTSFRRYCKLPVQDIRSSMQSRPSSGEIHVITGPMFAGKTTALIRRVQAEQSNGRNVAMIKSDKDTRYGLDAIVTHDGTKMPCMALPELSLFRERLGVESYNKLDVIGIDEAQFFEDLYDFCCNAADRDRKTVIVAGLDGDFLRRRFGTVLDIIPLADTVTKLTATCEFCGQHAFFTLRKTKETQTELIGGADVYMPVCRQHYVDGQLVMEATRIVLDAERPAVV
ncbi:hypothetical protein Cni_G20435 [Canna indica]|uniref:Thymidine kinase n=1 Tax=Canna indica TaxID=4628 RepID=A0AAQ3QJM8_9LILI|nr:hypothetical protein Cni_G20435 [Canna indica]